MKREVVETQVFSQELDRLIGSGKLKLSDFEEFVKEIVMCPEQGDVLRGTGGLRKVRLKASTRGKSGGFRVCYLDVPESEKLYLIVIFPKSVQENLKKEELSMLKKLVTQLKKRKKYE